MKIAASEGPLERRGGLLVMALKGEKALFKLREGRQIVGREDLSLNDLEIDFDLVEPTGVDRGVDEDGVGPLVTQAFNGFLATVGRAVVHDPEDSTSGFVGFLAHDFSDQPIHGSDATLDFAATEDFRLMDIPRCQVGPSSFAEVLMLDAHGVLGCWRQGRLFTSARLNAGFFVRGNDVVIDSQWSTLPDAFVKIEDRPGLVSEVRIARKNPASMLPRAERIATEPAP